MLYLVCSKKEHKNGTRINTCEENVEEIEEFRYLFSQIMTEEKSLKDIKQ